MTLTNAHQDAADGLCFNPIRKLLNPKFESYKLKQYDERDARRIKLPRRFHSAKQHERISFDPEELKLEARANNLMIGCFPSDKHNVQSHASTSQSVFLEPQLIWIDPLDLEIWSIVFDSPATLEQPQIARLLTLPTSRHEPVIGAKTIENTELDYPTAVPLPTGCTFDSTSLKPWLVLDGEQTLFLVNLHPNSPSVMARSDLGDELSGPAQEGDRSFRICSIQSISSSLPDTFWIILRSKTGHLGHLKTASVTTDQKKKLKPRFNVYLLELRVVSTMSSSENSRQFTLCFHRLAQLTGRHDLSFSEFDSTHQRWCFSSHSEYVLSQSQLELVKPNEQAEETKDQSPLGIPTEPPIPAPYNWSQTSTSLTLQFPLPLEVPSKMLDLKFDSDRITFKLHEPLSTSMSSFSKDFLDKLIQYFKYQQQDSSSSFPLQLELWDRIQPAESVWYIQSSKEVHSILTLELEKRQELRWPQVFKIDDRVDQVFDSADFEAIRSNLEKYTSDVDSGSQGAKHGGLGSLPGQQPSILLGSNQTSLAAGEIDEEIDSGDQTMNFGAVFTWLSPVRNDTKILGTEWKVTTPQAMIPVEIVSTKLPLYSLAPEARDSIDLNPSIMIKRDVDGLVFEPPTQPNQHPYRWIHTQTFPAMAFVMASKRDIRLACHTRQHAFIFENSSAPSPDHRPQIGNLFVYCHTQPPDETIADQLVIKLNTIPCGALIGVSGLRIPSLKSPVGDETGTESVLMVCLCEKELILCKVL